MNNPTHQDPTDRFTALIHVLLNDVAVDAPSGWVEIPLIRIVWRRLHRMLRVFTAILAQFRAGTLPAATPAPARPARARAATEPRAPRAKNGTERTGWVIHKISHTLFRRYELEEILDAPEMADLVAAAPQLGRALRPLCRMLAVKVPAWLRLPRLPRVRPPKPKRTLIRLGAGDLWRAPSPTWPTREFAQKFDAKTWV